MQGIFIGMKRPTSKAAIKRAVLAGDTVIIEATSMFGNEYEGSIASAPAGTYLFVGPDPYSKRNFYGKIVKSADGAVKVI